MHWAQVGPFGMIWECILGRAIRNDHVTLPAQTPACTHSVSQETPKSGQWRVAERLVGLPEAKIAKQKHKHPKENS